MTLNEIFTYDELVYIGFAIDNEIMSDMGYAEGCTDGTEDHGYFTEQYMLGKTISDKLESLLEKE